MRWADVASKSLGSTAEVLKRIAGAGKSVLGSAGGLVRGSFPGGLPPAVRRSVVMNIALKPAVGLAKGTVKASSWVFGQAVRRPIVTSAMGIGLAGTVGAFRGAYRAAVSAEPRRIYNDPQSPIVGPGYSVWAKERGMDPNALGASGSLALALHRVRHR